MNARPRPRPTTGPRIAEPAPAPDGGGAPGVVGRKAALSSVRPGPRAGDGRRPTGWLHIVAPPSYNATPSARSWCRCGQVRTARGRAGVLALIEAHNNHSNHCPLLTDTEGNKAA